ncbi:MAG: serine/threonine protein kinase, partial [Polyangiaceae bacterium]
MNATLEKLPQIGDVLLGKYLLESCLGEGGMGIVFAARHELLGQRVAVKLVQPSLIANSEAVARFVNEARASARIENDHVARVLDVG